MKKKVMPKRMPHADKAEKILDDLCHYEEEDAFLIITLVQQIIIAGMEHDNRARACSTLAMMVKAMKTVLESYEEDDGDEEGEEEEAGRATN
jgi:hypothetical protein